MYNNIIFQFVYFGKTFFCFYTETYIYYTLFDYYVYNMYVKIYNYIYLFIVPSIKHVSYSQETLCKIFKPQAI